MITQVSKLRRGERFKSSDGQTYVYVGKNVCGLLSAAWVSADMRVAYFDPRATVERIEVTS